MQSTLTAMSRYGICLAVLLTLDSCAANVRVMAEDSRGRICVWRQGDDGLTLRLAEEIRERFAIAGYTLGCDDEPPISLQILQIKDWEEIGERVRMVVGLELEFSGERAATVAFCWDDEMSECGEGILDWVDQEVSKIE